MTGAEAAVLAPFVTGQNVATTANFFVPTRGATTVISKRELKEEIKDIAGEWAPSSQLPITGHATLTFYKRRRVHATANFPMAISRLAKLGGRAVEKGALKATGKVAELFGKESKADALKEKADEVKVNKYKCRCAVPIDISFTVVQYEGHLSRNAEAEKERAEKLVLHEERRRKYEEDLAIYREVEEGKGKTQGEAPERPQEPILVLPTPPKMKIWLFTNVTVSVGAGVNNSLGEQVTLEVSCYPEWEPRDGSRWLRISWRAFNTGMKATKGFEHSGVAKAVLKSETKTGLVGQYDGAHLELGEQSDDETKHYFPGLRPKPELISSEKDKKPISSSLEEETEESEEDPPLPRAKPLPQTRPTKPLPALPQQNREPGSSSVLEKGESNKEKPT